MFPSKNTTFFVVRNACPGHLISIYGVAWTTGD